MSRGERRINAKSIMGVMMLAAGIGSVVQIETEGEREQEAMDALLALINDKFGKGSEAVMTIAIHGLPVARGIAIGRAVMVASSRVEVVHDFIERPGGGRGGAPARRARRRGGRAAAHAASCRATCRPSSRRCWTCT
jgi:hypothetical protein